MKRVTNSECPNCGSTKRVSDYNKGEDICRGCGLVLERHMVDDGLQRDKFDRPVPRVSPTPMSLHDKDLGSVISVGKRSILNSQGRRKSARLRFVQRRSRVLDQKEKSLRKGLMNISKIKGMFLLPQRIGEETAYLFRKYLKEKGLRRGQSVEQLSGSLVYLVARKNRIPISMKEFEQKTGIRIRTLGRSLRLLKEVLGYRVPLLEPVDFLNRYGSALKLSGQVVRQAREILGKYNRQGARPTILAGAALYYCAKMLNESITYITLCKITGLSPPEIRTIVKDLRRKFGEPDEL